MRRVLPLAMLLAVAGCATMEEKQSQWRAYADQQCAKLAGADKEKCVVDVVARCNSDHETQGALQKGCKP